MKLLFRWTSYCYFDSMDEILTLQLIGGAIAIEYSLDDKNKSIRLIL